MIWNWIVQNSSVIRDLGSILLGIFGIGFLAWRSRSADRQAEASQMQADVAQKQVSLARRDSLVDRYQKGSDMLGNETMSTRLGGMYSLKRLAEDHPKQFHIQVMELLCAFVRNPPPLKTNPERVLREDIQTALDIIIHRSDESIEIENASCPMLNKSEKRFRLDLHGANLGWAVISQAKLQGALLDNVNLAYSAGNGADFSGASMVGSKVNSKSHFIGAIFDKAIMNSADMSQAIFQNTSFVNTQLLGVDMSDSLFEQANMSKSIIGTANLTKARLDRADLSGAKFGGGIRSTQNRSTGVWTRKEIFCAVTQRQLDLAIADPDDPTSIEEGTTDTETGEQIVWNHQLCGDKWVEHQKLLSSLR